MLVCGIGEGADPGRADLLHVELHDRAAVEKIGGHLPAILDDGFRKRFAANFDRGMALARTFYGRFDLANQTGLI